MIYGYIAIALMIFGAGAWTGYTLESANTQRLQLAIVQSNLEAEQELSAAKNRVSDAEQRAKRFNDQLEAARDQSLNTANALIDRVRSASKQDCKNPMPSRNGAGVSQREAADHSRLDEFSRLARDSAAYAESCWQFVTHNCGIEND